jgi:DNA-binding NtrC family response regulator
VVRLLVVKNPGYILIADDDLPLLNATAQFLRHSGYRCDTVSDATEAVRRLSEADYDLLISDLEMPGNQDMRLIRDLPQIAAGMPVILMTAYPSVETAIQSIQLPVSAYLVKPSSNEKLLEEVKRAIENYHAYRVVRINHQRIAEWNRNLAQIENNMKQPPRRGAPPWRALLDLTMRNITDAAADLRVFAELVSQQQDPEAEGEATDSARPLLLLKALRETIDVLEKTRSSFKSKDLGELRRKLEALVQSEGD